MTLWYIVKAKKSAAVVVVCLLAGVPVLVRAQAGQAAAAAAKALQAAPPTGPMSALTRVADAVHASRAMAMAGKQAGTAAAGAGAARSTTVMGYLWTGNNTPISNATVQLRNTVTGQVEVFSKTNAAGEFLFDHVNGGSYVIEYVNNVADAGQTVASAASKAGNVLAVGHPFSVAPGETVATFVRTINAVPIFIPDVAGNVAASAMQTAASAGVTAVVTPISPVEDLPPPPPVELPGGGGFVPGVPGGPPPASGIK